MPYTILIKEKNARGSMWRFATHARTLAEANAYLRHYRGHGYNAKKEAALGGARP